jgi:hypothetical protein
VNFWMPIPAAGLAYLSLRAESLRLPDSWRQLIRRPRDEDDEVAAGDLPLADDLPRRDDLPSGSDVRSDDDAPQHP